MMTLSQTAIPAQGNTSPIAVATLIALGLTLLMYGPAHADGLSVNYDNLASLEEPLAADVADITFTINGVLDEALAVDLKNDNDAEGRFTGNFEVGAETQLGNRWTVGVAYFGQYQNNPGNFSDLSASNNHYTDNVAGYIGGAWGTLIGGEVTGAVREDTRRARGAGNAALAFDDFYGGFDDWAGGYTGRFGPVRATGIVDEDGNFDVGAMWSRPIGNKDYRLTARYADSQYGSADGTTTFDSDAAGVVGELVYGSGTYDIGLGYEELSSSTVDTERWFASTGARYKTGALTFSVEGHYGEVAGEEEVSAAAGAAYDIARGLSANVGLNYAKVDADKAGVSIVDKDATEATLSLRYSF